MADDMTNEIINQIPESVRFSSEDADALMRNKEALLAFEEGLVQGFYDTLYGYDVTRAVFVEGEREDREQTLRDWYRRSLSGPFDDSYWEWQTFVGLVHIKRKVNNAMVSGMWGWILSYLGKNALDHLPAEEALAVIKAVHALQASVMALISESYLRGMFVAVDKASGINEALLNRLVNIEIDEMLESARKSFQGS